MPFNQAASRRQFLKFLSASPLLASPAWAGEGPTAGIKLPANFNRFAGTRRNVILMHLCKILTNSRISFSIRRASTR